MRLPRADSPEARELVARVIAAPPATDEGSARAYAAIVWSCVLEPGDGTAGSLIAALGADAALEAVRSSTLDALSLSSTGLDPAEFRRGVDRWLPRLGAADPAAVVDSATRVGARLVLPGSPMWPGGADDLGAHAPIGLWVRGDIRALRALEPAVALVGARAATGYGEHVAGEMAADLAGRGIAVVSGAAYGIDGAAHRGALSAGGRTIALLAGGVDRAYPAGHATLLDRIAHEGAVVSEVPCGSAPTKWRFLQQNLRCMCDD